MQRATIYSIASTVGVSPSTVSRAFSRPEMVKSELRERIVTTARELGYSPNRAARGLATGRTGVIGMLVPDVENPFFPPLIRAVQGAARDKDAELLLIDSELSASAEQELVDRIRPQVDGLIIASPRLPSKELARGAARDPFRDRQPRRAEPSGRGLRQHSRAAGDR